MHNNARMSSYTNLHTSKEGTPASVEMRANPIIPMRHSCSNFFRPRQWLGWSTLVLILALPLSVLAQAAATTVTITKRAPLEMVTADGTLLGVSDATVGAKMTWVSTAGSEVTLQDAQGHYYRIAVASTDYVPPVAEAAPSSPRVTPASAPSDNAQPPTQTAVAAAPSGAISGNDTAPDFGPNVLVFDPTTDPAVIQSKCAAIFATQEKNQFGPERNAILFKPGTYQAKIDVGFYTQVYGLGKLPDDVTINGEVRTSGDWDNGNCTQNFWRGCENLAIVPSDEKDMWAVSQAAPFRRVHVKGGLDLFQVHDGRGGWASGGFMADCKIDGRVVPGSQQQWFSRNSDWSDWTNGVWNMVFLGVSNPPQGTWPDKPYTVIEKTPYIREKPFLYVDDGEHYKVFVPGVRKDCQGVSWADGKPVGDSISLSQFYIAHPE